MDTAILFVPWKMGVAIKSVPFRVVIDLWDSEDCGERRSSSLAAHAFRCGTAV